MERGRAFEIRPDFDKIVKSRFKGWIPAPRLRGNRLSGYDVYGIYLILIYLLSFPRRRESRKWENPSFYETINFSCRYEHYFPVITDQFVKVNWGMVLSLAILLGFADRKKWLVRRLVRRRRRNPTKDVGMLNPTYE